MTYSLLLTFYAIERDPDGGKYGVHVPRHLREERESWTPRPRLFRVLTEKCHGVGASVRIHGVDYGVTLVKRDPVVPGFKIVFDDRPSCTCGKGICTCDVIGHSSDCYMRRVGTIEHDPGCALLRGESQLIDDCAVCSASHICPAWIEARKRPVSVVVRKRARELNAPCCHRDC